MTVPVNPTEAQLERASRETGLDPSTCAKVYKVMLAEASGGLRYLTDRQLSVYRFIHDWFESRGVAARPPKIREIAEHLGTHSSNAHRIFMGCVKRGWILYNPRADRPVIPLYQPPEGGTVTSP